MPRNVSANESESEFLSDSDNHHRQLYSFIFPNYFEEIEVLELYQIENPDSVDIKALNMILFRAANLKTHGDDFYFNCITKKFNSDKYQPNDDYDETIKYKISHHISNIMLNSEPFAIIETCHKFDELYNRLLNPTLDTEEDQYNNDDQDDNNDEPLDDLIDETYDEISEYVEPNTESNLTESNLTESNLTESNSNELNEKSDREASDHSDGEASDHSDGEASDRSESDKSTHSDGNQSTYSDDAASVHSDNNSVNNSSDDKPSYITDAPSEQFSSMDSMNSDSIIQNIFEQIMGKTEEMMDEIMEEMNKSDDDF